MQRNRIQLNLLITCLPDQFDRIVENGERRQAQKIHFEQAHLLDRDHIERGDDFVILSLVKGN